MLITVRHFVDVSALILSATEDASSRHGFHDLKGDYNSAPLENFLFTVNAPGQVGPAY